MRHTEIITLQSITSGGRDEYGNLIENVAKREIYANEFGVNFSQFLGAAQAGFRIEKVFEVYSFEYQGEERLEHGGQVFRIFQANTKGDKTRLVCGRMIADV